MCSGLLNRYVPRSRLWAGSLPYSCQAAGEHFDPGHAEKLAAALGDRATVRSFTAAESAAYHSHIGAFVLMNGVVLDWIAKLLSAPQAKHSRGEDRGKEQREGEDVLR